MCKMYGIIEALCATKGIKPGKMCADLGISRGVIGDLKAGRTKKLSSENVAKIASYFGVSADYLLGDGEDNEKTPTVPGKRSLDGQDTPARNIIRIAGRDGSYEERVLTDEQIAAVKSILSQLPDASGDL